MNSQYFYLTKSENKTVVVPTLHKYPDRSVFTKLFFIQYLCDVLQIFCLNFMRFPVFLGPTKITEDFSEVNSARS